MRIDVECNPSKADMDVLSRGIVAFNDQAVADLEPVEAEKRFHVLARDEHGNVQGGIRATCYWNTLHIELLWLAEQARGSGVGRNLIDRAEAFAITNNCQNGL